MPTVVTSLKHVKSEQDQRCASCRADFIPVEDSGSRVLTLKIGEQETVSALMCGGCASKWAHGTTLKLEG
ncbi:MAG TPA: hypothetical protein VF147_12395 [Vicinamibacterales bacterium]